MVFEVGKFYKHSDTDTCIVIVSECEKAPGEKVLLIEHGGDPDHGIYGIDINDKNTEGFCEIKIGRASCRERVS